MHSDIHYISFPSNVFVNAIESKLLKLFVAIYPNFPCKTRDILLINLFPAIPQQIRTYFLCAVLFSIESRNRLKNSLNDGSFPPCQ